MDARCEPGPCLAGRLLGTALLVALLLVDAPRAQAGPAKLVKDIERTSLGCDTSDFVSGPGALYFGTGVRCRGGLAIWRTDGTKDGTRVVKAFTRGPRDLGFVQPIATTGEQLFFGLAEHESWGSPIVEMWRTDGTEAGTVLVWEAADGQWFDHQVKSTSRTEVALGNKLIFTVDEGYTDASLWVSDGTPGGTHPVHDLGDGPHHVVRFLARDDAVFFVVYGPGGSSLWRSDGTAGGTELVRNFGSHAIADGPTLAPDGSIFFTVNLGPGSNELWKSGGTADGTSRVLALPFATTWLLVGDVHFVLEARRVGVNVWRYDPESNQIQLVRNLDSAPRGDNEIFVYGDRDGVLYFSHFAFLGSREKLWRSDGTPDGTFVLYDGLLTGLVVEGRNGFVFEPDPLDGPRVLWHTDGTVAGTQQVLAAGPDVVRFGDVTSTDDTTLLVATSWDSVTELLRTDGTSAGTVPIGSPPFPPALEGFGVHGSRAVFRVGADLWRSDGTASGTGKLVALGTGTADAWPHSLTDVEGVLFFVVAGPVGRANELWRTDGTRSETRLVADFADGADGLRLPTASGGRLLFARGTRELWVSDGSPEGTRLLTDVGSVAEGARITAIVDADGFAVAAVVGANPLEGALLRIDVAAETTSVLAPVAPGSLATFGGAVYFGAPVSPATAGLWRSDGTVAGTAAVAVFRAGTKRKRPVIGRLFVDADALFFSVGRQRQLELWRSDGTTDGTTRVAGLPLPSGASGRGAVLDGAFRDGLLLFSHKSESGLGGPNLWRSDGTEAGTAPVGRVGIGFAIDDMTQLGDRVLFVTPTDSPPILYFASALWATDGTEAGTVRLLDGDVVGGSLRVLGDTAFFCARTEQIDDVPRLWRTDGTPAGTLPAFDRTLSCTGALALSSGELFFTASTRRYGAELWAAPLDAP